MSKNTILIKYVFLTLVILPFYGLSKNISRVDTVCVKNNSIDPATIQNYQDILEKTNMQLSLWWNPYGLLIAILGVLFTILTIISAVVIYRQSKEYRELINQSISKHELLFNDLIAEKNQQLLIIENNLNALINEYKEKLATVGEDQKNEINEIISRLETERKSIDNQINAKYVTPEYSDTFLTVGGNFGLKNSPHKCSKCGYGYFVKDIPITLRPSISIGLTNTKTITCPKCGNVEILNSFF